MHIFASSTIYDGWWWMMSSHFRILGQSRRSEDLITITIECNHILGMYVLRENIQVLTVIHFRALSEGAMRHANVETDIHSFSIVYHLRVLIDWQSSNLDVWFCDLIWSYYYHLSLLTGGRLKGLRMAAMLSISGHGNKGIVRLFKFNPK